MGVFRKCLTFSGGGALHPFLTGGGVVTEETQSTSRDDAAGEPSILAGATVRIPFLFPIFGEGRWVGSSAPSSPAVFLLTRSLLLGCEEVVRFVGRVPPVGALSVGPPLGLRSEACHVLFFPVFP